MVLIVHEDAQLVAAALGMSVYDLTEKVIPVFAKGPREPRTVRFEGFTATSHVNEADGNIHVQLKLANRLNDYADRLEELYIDFLFDEPAPTTNPFSENLFLESLAILKHSYHVMKRAALYEEKDK